jgi:hypothetical protein
LATTKPLGTKKIETANGPFQSTASGLYAMAVLPP